MKQSEKTRSLGESIPSIDWRYVLSCAIVGAAVFIFAGLLWPATSGGIRASTSIDFSLPENISSLSKREVDQLKSVLGQTVAKTLSGSSFDALITQTKRSGSIISNEIEYHDLETIRNSIELGFVFRPDGGQVEIGYQCDGHSDQLRFLQLLGHRISTSIDQAYLDADNGVTIAHDYETEKFERAIWLARQLRADLSELQTMRAPDGLAATTSSRNNKPFRLASARTIDPLIANEINADNVSALTRLLDDLQANAKNTEFEGATFDVLNVTRVDTYANGATPGRIGLLFLVSLSAVVTGFVAIFWNRFPRGFASPDAMSATLGIPVVAVVSEVRNKNSESAMEQVCARAAGRLVEISKIFLLTFLLIIIGFAFLDGSIRESIFQNPFDGVAKIINVFFKYG